MIKIKTFQVYSNQSIFKSINLIMVISVDE